MEHLPQMTPARLKALHETGLSSVGDLLRHYPRRHEDRRRFAAFSGAISSTGPLCLRGVVLETKLARFGRKSMFTLLLGEDAGGTPATLRCRWFNMAYLSRALQAGQNLVIYGQPKVLKKGGVIFDHPEFEVISAEHGDPAVIHLNRIVPIHSAIGPWSSRHLRRLIHDTLADLDEDATEEAVGGAREPASSMTLSTALRAIHFPRSESELETVRRLLAGDELLEMQCVLLRQRQRHIRGEAPRIVRDNRLLSQFIRNLPFPLTGAQKRVLGQIYDDLDRGHPMNRLLHGDVGSGKTIVAAIAMLGAVAAGHSAALMAPTQVLAGQHHENFVRLLGPLGIPVELHTASTKPSKPRPPGPRVIIGTHALLFAESSGDPLGLVVIDEQHKFGVRQRARLAATDPHPHVLVMSATPIPRTLALTLYGDLDISVLDEMPPGRQPVRTLVRPHGKLDDAVKFVLGQLEAGRQAYIVYPVIEKSAKAAVKTAVQEYGLWRERLAPHACALLHGRLPAADKTAVMEGFRRGDIRVLVSTTVIEVGIDVANAGVLLVENAERFGLAQLHQLRGRVGRGTEKSWCVLLAGESAEDKLERLQVLERAADGFAIAEADLALRGPGDLLGTAQTGLPPIRLARLPADLTLLEQAREQARNLLTSDPDLLRSPRLAARLQHWEHQIFAGVA